MPETPVKKEKVSVKKEKEEPPKKPGRKPATEKQPPAPKAPINIFSTVRADT